MKTPADRCREFRQLHESGWFVIPNPWDVGSARVLAQFGFPALATTSSGFAWSLGRSDNRVTLDEALAHFRSVAESVDIPLNGDFEGGFAIEPRAVGANVARATTTGVAGLSIEDSTYAEAGADCLYAPGIRTTQDIAAVVSAVSPKPVNVLVGGDFTTVAALADAGVRRISVGGALARTAWTGFLHAAREIAERGTFGSLTGAVPFDEVNGLFD